MNAKFDAIIEADYAVRCAHTRATFGIDGATRARGQRDLKAAKAKMFALIDELTMDEAAAFGPYRRARVLGNTK